MSRKAPSEHRLMSNHIQICSCSFCCQTTERRPNVFTSITNKQQRVIVTSPGRIDMLTAALLCSLNISTEVTFEPSFDQSLCFLSFSLDGGWNRNKKMCFSIHVSAGGRTVETKAEPLTDSFTGRSVPRVEEACWWCVQGPSVLQVTWHQLVTLCLNMWKQTAAGVWTWRCRRCTATWSWWCHHHVTADTLWNTTYTVSYLLSATRGQRWEGFFLFCCWVQRQLLIWPRTSFYTTASTSSPERRKGGGWSQAQQDHLPRSESLLIGCQVLLSSLVSLQSFDGVDVLRQLRLPPHQDLVLLQILQTLWGLALHGLLQQLDVFSGWSLRFHRVHSHRSTVTVQHVLLLWV